MRFREPAICLRTTDFSETSQVVHFLTRGEGVVHLMAKGSKRSKSKSGGAIDLMSEGELVYIHHGGETLGTLVEFSESVSHSPLRRDERRLYTGLFMIELVGAMLAVADPHPEVFDLLHNGLTRLAAPDAPVPAVLAYFQWRLLRNVGLLGDMGRCTSCGGEVRAGSRRNEPCFSSTSGGLLCADCRPVTGEQFRIDADTLAGLAVLRGIRPGQKASLPDDQAHAVNRLLSYHACHQLGKPLKLVRYAINGK